MSRGAVESNFGAVVLFSDFGETISYVKTFHDWFV